jgi:hypothetical protein
MSGQGVARFWRAPSWEEIAAAEAKEKPELEKTAEEAISRVVQAPKPVASHV